MLFAPTTTLPGSWFSPTPKTTRYIVTCRRKSRSDTQARVIFLTRLDKCEQNLETLRWVSWSAIWDRYVTFVTFFRWQTYTAVSVQKIKFGRNSTYESAVAFLPHLIQLNSTRQKCDIWTGPERLKLSWGHHAYVSAAPTLRPQIKDGVDFESLYWTEGFARMASKISMRAITLWPGLRTQKRLILISFVNHLAFRGTCVFAMLNWL